MHTQVFRENPEFAGFLADAINVWSWVEDELAELMAIMVGAPFAVSMATYNTLGSLEIRLSATQKVAKLVLSKELRDKLVELFKVVRKTAKRRNKLAHSLWTVSSEGPDSLMRTPHYSEVQGDRDQRELWSKQDFVDVWWASTVLFTRLRQFTAEARAHLKEHPPTRGRSLPPPRGPAVPRDPSKTSPSARAPPPSSGRRK
jgi:hypothetical protein